MCEVYDLYNLLLEKEQLTAEWRKKGVGYKNFHRARAVYSQRGQNIMLSLMQNQLADSNYISTASFLRLLRREGLISDLVPREIRMRIGLMLHHTIKPLNPEQFRDGLYLNPYHKPH